MNVGHYCSICYEDGTDYSTVCNHRFHQACLNLWTEQCRNILQTPSCPLCRRDIIHEQPNNSEIYISNTSFPISQEYEFFRNFGITDNRMQTWNNMLGERENGR
jgi:hypothetical protein